METSTVLLSTAYFPPVDYFRAIARSGGAVVEAYESFQKQSFRNRCVIYAGDGAQTLQLPVLHSGSRLIRDIRIDYTKNWLHLHRRAIASAYGPSPFFEYYWDDIDSILGKRHEFLFDLNTELTMAFAGFLHLKTPIVFTSDYEAAPAGVLDLRGAIHPKKESPFGDSFKEYYQVFNSRFGFLPNLSILDLLFCEGPEAINYL